MQLHRISVAWNRDGGPFVRGNYRKEQQVGFDGGQTLEVSASPDLGGSKPNADPEQLLLAALSTCHLLTVLAIAANRGFVLDSYDDDADCELGKDAEGRTFVTRATLRPRIRFGGSNVPTKDELAKLHERAHRACFIANSVRTHVEVAPRD